MLRTTTAMILAGGLGTRLKSVVDEVPKPMADIGGKPFLHYLFLYLHQQGLKQVVLLVGYKHTIIQNYFGKRYLDIEIAYSIESEPLGTGGAVLQASAGIDQPYFLLNGDTYFEVNLAEMENSFNRQPTDVVIALSHQKNFDRYGTVKFNYQHRVIGFEEKKWVTEGWINGGVYWLHHQFFQKISHSLHVQLPKKFSIEKDIFEPLTDKLNLFAYPQGKYFIDIGIPDDYRKAQTELPEMFCRK
jgi:D-glycero-alpha-D-manno-heptose 1-phosphate guanylyltransferase